MCGESSAAVGNMMRPTKGWHAWVRWDPGAASMADTDSPPSAGDAWAAVLAFAVTAAPAIRAGVIRG